MNPETNPYIPAAGSRPPVLAGREDELDTFTGSLGVQLLDTTMVLFLYNVSCQAHFI